MSLARSGGPLVSRPSLEKTRRFQARILANSKGMTMHNAYMVAPTCGWRLPAANFKRPTKPSPNGTRIDKLLAEKIARYIGSADTKFGPRYHSCSIFVSEQPKQSFLLLSKGNIAHARPRGHCFSHNLICSCFVPRFRMQILG